MNRILLALAMMMPSVAAAAPRTFKDLADQWVNIINAGIGIALTLGIVVYFYGIITTFRNSKGGFTNEYRNQLLWGLLALFVMFSVWGILGLIRNTLFGGGAGGFNSGYDSAECDSLEECVIIEEEDGE